ncbi:MAG: hypothetical protein HN597_03605 [Desulfobacula sp.]|jgi:hypothetical protein|uniref:hypothetical protein n=1 Tax=Desulfobacula sp. TaxID=2593537 RepID=UPI0039B9281C|nr:hypothetical protein [Desulfobacula sp.]
MEILPYVFLKDRWSIPYDTIKSIWEKMQEEKSVESVFCTGTVKTFEEFNLFLRNPKNSVVTIWQGNEIVFLGWLNSFNLNSAAAHFNCFKPVWGRSVEVGKMALKYWFGFKFMDTIIGTVPDDNQRAINMVKKCGATVIGTIPSYSTNIYTNKKIGATILFFERGDKWI